MRSREPDASGYVVRDGVKLYYEVFGDGDPTVLLLPTWSIVHSRAWKAQIGYLARKHRVVTFDGRGNGRSGRPAAAEAYTHREFVADTLAVMDATDTDRAVLVALSMGALWGTQLAADRPDRVLGLVCIGPAVPFGDRHPDREAVSFDDELDTTDGWAKYNRHYWVDGDYHDFLGFFFGQMFSEPHSTKQIEDCVGWGHEIAPETLVATQDGASTLDAQRFRETCGRVHCPVLVIHGHEDAIRAHESGVAFAEATGGSLVTITGGGHGPLARDPVKTNLLLEEFIGTVSSTPPTRRLWTRALNRPKRALYVSSPIGLGHARRDIAIAQELRRLHPDLEIDWLAQHPVTTVLSSDGERIHPASAHLASESAHIEHESAEHDLHAFQAIRRMDEILVNNFMVFADLVAAEPYDLWIGDEAWDVDYFLHENPELKNTSFAWMTDFVGWLPMPDGGADETRLTSDYNAEMIEQRARFQRVRDRSIFVGNPDDIVPDAFGPDLPLIRAWTEDNFDFAGYVTGFDPAALGDRLALRSELGYRSDERVCVVTVGGSGVGTALLEKVVDAYPSAASNIPGLRMVVVTGPRIDPASVRAAPGVEVLGYLPKLYRHLAACDLAVVQGGLTTCMELTANRRPFLYFPLGHHFEQNVHVRHRLERYGAGRRMDYRQTTSEQIAQAISATIDTPVDYRPVETDGAARAARLLAELL